MSRLRTPLKLKVSGDGAKISKLSSFSTISVMPIHKDVDALSYKHVYPLVIIRKLKTGKWSDDESPSPVLQKIQSGDSPVLQKIQDRLDAEMQSLPLKYLWVILK